MTYSRVEGFYLPLSSLFQDLRFAVRGYWRRPLTPIAVVLILAIGTGAANVMFTVLHETVLRPLPYTAAERLVALSEQSRTSDDDMVSWPDFVDWRRDLKSFSSLSAIGGVNLNWTGYGQADRLAGLRISSSLFAQLGVRFTLGRNFVASEDQPGAAPAVIVSQELWRERFGGRQDILGQTMRLDDRVFTIVGVVPADFRFLYARDVYLPFGLDSTSQPGRAIRSVARVIGELKPGVSLSEARRELISELVRLNKLYPQEEGEVRGQVRPMTELIAAPARKSVLLLSLAVALLLAITCANVASLLVASGMRRRSELQLRQAIGASRFRLLSQLLTESSLLCVTGSLLGLLLAQLALPSVAALIPTDGGAQTFPLDVSLHARVVAFTAMMTAMVCLAAGLTPALANMGSAAHSSSRHSASGYRGLSAGNLLVVAQVSLSVVLLFSAGLMTRSLERLSRVDLGFSESQLLTARLKIPSTAYPTPESRSAVYGQLLNNVRNIPEVAESGAATCLPFGGRDCWVSTITLASGSKALQPVHMNAVSDGYRQTLGLRLLSGRDFDGRDDRSHPRVAIVNQTFASRYLQSRSALGRNVYEGGGSEQNEYQIIGVIGDARTEAPEIPAEPELWLPMSQFGPHSVNLVLRSRVGNSGRIEAEVRRIVRQTDPDVPLFDVRLLSWYMSRETSGRLFPTLFLVAFAFVALFLTALGIYGLVAGNVQSRTREFAIRLAIGATRLRIAGLVLDQITRLMLIGVAVGGLLAWVTSRFLRHPLYGITSGDLVTVVLSGVVLGVMAGAGVLIPTHRAMAVDPGRSLKVD